ncbi:MAG: CARDB domain-containing protein [Thermoplasmatota archaeon]
MNRSIYKDESGVSEVVGSILTLSITVVLFSSIFGAVSMLETPERSTYVDFEADIEFNTKLSVSYINITNKGGHDMETYSTRLYLVLNDVETTSFSFTDPELKLSGEDDDEWEMKEKVTIKLDSETIPLNNDIYNADKIEMVIVDQNTNSVVWRSEVTKDVSAPIMIRNVDIEYDPMHPWKNYGDRGEAIILKAEVIAPGLEPGNVSVNATMKGEVLTPEDKKTYELNHTKGNKYEIVCDVSTKAEDGTYPVKFTAESFNQSASSTYANLNIGEYAGLENPPDIVVGNVEFTPLSPTEKERITVTASVYNNGDFDIRSNITIWDNHTKTNRRKQVVPTMENVTLRAGPSPTRVSATFRIENATEHQITFNASNSRGDEIFLNYEVEGEWEEGPDNNWDDNEATGTVYVNPRILIVDDGGSVQKESVYMQDALDELDYDYSVTNVEPGEDGPDKEILYRYGLTIWMTGSDDISPLTGDDVDNIEDYMDDGNKVWLIGLNLNRVDNNLLQNYFGANSIEDSTLITEGLRVPILGENGTFGNFKYPAVHNSFCRPITDTGGYEEKNMLSENYGDGYLTGAGYERNGDNRSVLSSYLFNSIDGSTMRTTMAQEVIGWLVNITSRSGIDISVSSQSIVPSAPMFRDEVIVNATLRNNGLEDQNVTVRMQVDDDFDLIQPNQGDTLFLEGKGGTGYVTFNWTAQPIGRHTLRVIADPYDDIEETNEENNDITYKDLNVSGDQVEVNVRFSTLVVDDDQSDDGYEDTTGRLLSVMNELGYEEGSDYDVFESGPNSGPTADEMNRYNAVYWVTGQSEDTIHPDEIEELIDYEESNGYLNRTGTNVLFIGDNIIEDLNGTSGHGDAMLEMMGIEPTSISYDDVEPDRLSGVRNHNISHGMKYSLDGASVRSFDDVSDHGEVLFTDENGNNISSFYGDGESKVVLLGVDLFSIDGPIAANFTEWPAGDVETSDMRAIDEFIYMVGREFGKIDERPELRVSDLDVELNTDNPMLTRSYKIKAVIENIGFESASPLVRFLDGDSYIGSNTPTILPTTRTTSGEQGYFDVNPGKVTIEARWSPSKAGSRTIQIQVDPEGEIDEINNDSVELMEFNNLAEIDKEVYYFWDDMEDGADKWDHDTQLAMINGEQPLEYLSEEYDEVYTDIVSEWNKSMSKRYEKTDYYSYSDPSSFRLNETLDESGEETNSDDGGMSLTAAPPQPDLKATQLVSNGKFSTDDSSWTLTEPQSQGVAEWDGTMNYVDGGSIHISASATNEATNIEEAQWAQSIGPTSNTLTVNGVYNMDLTTQQSVQAPISSTVEIQLFDTGTGAWETVYSYSDTDTVSTGWVEFGPDATYSPTGEVNEIRAYLYISSGSSNNKDSNGDLWMDNISATIPSVPGNTPPLKPFNPSPENGATDVNTNPTLTVNVSDPDGDSMNVRFYNASDNSLIDSNSGVTNGTTSVTWNGLAYGYPYEWYAEASDGYRTNTSTTWSFTTEYKGGGVQDIRAYGPNKNKTIVTETVNLSDYSSATLSFFHKYKIRDGNGALLEVGYFNDNDDEWQWIYMIPSLNTYNGQLNMSSTNSDDRQDYEGTQMDWCWSGTSGGGSFGWDYVKANLLNYVPEGQRDEVRVRFNYTQYENGTGYGWFIDNVGISATRDDSGVGENVGPDMKDVWRRVYENDTHGNNNTAWWNGIENPDNDGQEEFKPGIDNRLTTKSIDLTNARTANMSAYFKFNINGSSGAPPDGFRVEITLDNGVTWMPINVGTRTAYGVSGEGTDQSYQGLDAGNHWTTASSLQRLNVDLSDFSGETIKLRFRVVTSTGSYQHFEDDTYDFGGFYVDDVVVSGESVGGS